MTSDTQDDESYPCPHCGLLVLPAWGPCAHAARRWLSAPHGTPERERTGAERYFAERRESDLEYDAAYRAAAADLDP
jgi:hypothetical protein